MPLFLGALLLAGCGGPDHQGICEKIEDCRDPSGNDKDVAACVAQLDYAEDISSDQGCGDEYDVYFEGVEQAASCKNHNFGVDKNECEAEANAFNRCADVNVEVD